MQMFAIVIVCMSSTGPIALRDLEKDREHDNESQLLGTDIG